MTKKNRNLVKCLVSYWAEMCSLLKCFRMAKELERKREWETATILKLCRCNKLFAFIYDDYRSNSNSAVLYDLLSTGLPCTSKSLLGNITRILLETTKRCSRVKEPTTFKSAGDCVWLWLFLYHIIS